MIEGITRAAVIGLARAGRAAAAALQAQGIRVTAFDAKSPDPGEFELVANWDGVLPLDDIQLVVPSPAVPRNHPALQAASARGIAIWSEPELGYRISTAPIWAVTGTNGKSTTTAMLHSIAKAAGMKPILCGNIAGEGIDSRPVAAAAMTACPDDLLVAEISSFQLEWVREFRPRLAVLTNIAWDHKERYDGLDDYARTKQRIFAAQTPHDVAVTGVPEANTAGARRVVSGYDLPNENCAFWRGGKLVLRLDGTERELIDEETARHTGKVNLPNATAAAAGTAALGVSTAAIVAGLQSFVGLPHRMQVVGRARGITFFDNSCATNPDSAAAAIRALEQPTTVLMGGWDKQVPLDPLIAAALSLVRPPVVYGAIGEKLSAALATASIRHTRREDLAGAFDLALEQAEPRDAIALIPACSSFDAYEDFQHRARHFRELVNAFAAKEVAP